MNTTDTAGGKGSMGINFFPKEHVWVPTEVPRHSWDSDKLAMHYMHRPINDEDKRRRELVLELLRRDTPTEAKAEICEALQQLRWPCHE